jgi:hypothetical protein
MICLRNDLTEKYRDATTSPSLSTASYLHSTQLIDFFTFKYWKTKDEFIRGETLALNYSMKLNCWKLEVNNNYAN